MGSPVAPIKRGARGRPSSSAHLRAQLAERLASRRGEIEAAALTRIHAISDPAETEDPQYVEGLRAALVAALDYGLAAIELGEERCPPPPPALLVQARMAARAGVSLDTVLRRYFAGYALLGDFLIEEVEAMGLKGAELKRLLRTQAVLFERLLAAVGEEHGREAKPGPDTAEKRRREQIRRLLSGELVDTSVLAYDFEGHHLGLIAQGPGAWDAVRELAGSLDRSLLPSRSDGGAVWGWLGGGRPISPEEVERLAPSAIWPAGTVLALGEPGHGLEGWRLTHRQAAAALPIALRSPASPVWYADVALVASMLQDDLLSTSLRQRYLDPISRGGDGDERLPETLRAYFAADHNVSSTAASLGVKRHTVSNRIRMVEKRLNRPLSCCRAELETILRLDGLEDKLAH